MSHELALGLGTKKDWRILDIQPEEKPQAVPCSITQDLQCVIVKVCGHVGFDFGLFPF